MLSFIIKIFGTLLFIFGISSFYGKVGFSKKSYKIFGILCLIYIVLNISNMIFTKNFYKEIIVLNLVFLLIILILNYFSNELYDFENGNFRTVFYPFIVIVLFAAILYVNFKVERCFIQS